MAYSKMQEVSKKLLELQGLFKLQLPKKLNEMANLWQALLSDAGKYEDLDNLLRLSHNMAGSGGTFGAIAVSRIAHDLELVLQSLLVDVSLPEQSSRPEINNSKEQQVDQLMAQISLAIDNWKPSSVPYLKPNANLEERDNELIFVAEDDELLAEDLITKLEEHDFKVRLFTELVDFEVACLAENPSAIIMDMVFAEGNVAGADLIVRLKEAFAKESRTCPPVIFISVRNDIDVRLAAARAGARRYFCKPLDVGKLIQTLDGLTLKTTKKPYKVLLIDDDQSLLEYYKTALVEAGMDVKVLKKPMEGLLALTEFKPDVLVLDVYMPECTGPELAQVIRQDDNWAQMPIIFLSTEPDLNRQLDAMNLGGDDFIIKPVEVNHLVSAITARAKRARWTTRLNKDLANSLRESEYNNITLNQHSIVSSTDIEGNIIEVNQNFCNISGYTSEELLGNNHRMIKSDYHSKEFYADLWGTISQGKVWHGTLCNQSKSGSTYWVKSTIVPFLDDMGKPYKYVSARSDISEIITTQERLAQTYELAKIGHWDWNVKTGELIWSDNDGNLLNVDGKDQQLTADDFLAALYPEDKERVIAALMDCVKNAVPYDIEHRMIRADGTVLWIRGSGNVTRDKDGRATHMLGVIQNITNQKEVEKKLTIAQEEADNANRAKSQFLSSMSHELRTPMNAIMGFNQLLTMDTEHPLSTSQLENSQEITKASGHLLNLINEVLDLARIEAGHIELSIETIFLGDVLSESLQLIMPLSNKRGIQLSLSKNGEVCSIEKMVDSKYAIRADHTRLRQVFLNLLSNAVKYNRENGELIISCKPVSDDQMRISFSDTGEGLSEEQQNNLFKAFNRLGAEKGDIEGTGIGLIITKNIIELMGGKIGVDSELGKGSTFWIELQIDSMPQEAVMVEEVIGNTQLQETPTEEEKQFSVLYIEDNPANLRLVSQLFARLSNLRMWSAPEPLLGLELAAEHKPDLILLDINLPGMDGFEVLKHLQQRDSSRNTPVIAISANAMPKDIEKGMEAGFDEYITKPIDVNALMQAVKSRLNNDSK